MSVTSNIVIARLVTASRLDANRMRRGGWSRSFYARSLAAALSLKLPSARSCSFSRHDHRTSNGCC
jgi:hypothetical protein